MYGQYGIINYKVNKGDVDMNKKAFELKNKILGDFQLRELECQFKLLQRVNDEHLTLHGEYNQDDYKKLCEVSDKYYARYDFLEKLYRR